MLGGVTLAVASVAWALPQGAATTSLSPQMYHHVSTGVVRIEVRSCNPDRVVGQGTGFMVGRQLVMTARHVLELPAVPPLPSHPGRGRWQVVPRRDRQVLEHCQREGRQEGRHRDDEARPTDPWTCLCVREVGAATRRHDRGDRIPGRQPDDVQPGTARFDESPQRDTDALDPGDLGAGGQRLGDARSGRPRRGNPAEGPWSAGSVHRIPGRRQLLRRQPRQVVGVGHRP